MADKTFIRRVVNATDRQTDRQQHGRGSDDSSASTILVVCLVMSLITGFRKGKVLLPETEAKLSQIPGWRGGNSWKGKGVTEEWGRKGVSRERVSLYL